MTVNGIWTIDATVTGRLPWSVTVNGATADATFSGVQALNRLELKNGATADFSGSGSVLSIANDLSVTAGAGNLNMITGNGSVSGGFNISANCTFNKLGPALFSVSAPQTNGAGSTLNVQAGNFNMFTDAGSTSSRTLTINSSANTFLGFNEHLAALNVANGTTTVLQNGNRVWSQTRSAPAARAACWIYATMT